MAGDPVSHTIDLETLARRQFPEKPLSKAEHRLLLAAPKGEWAVCGPNQYDRDPDSDPAKAEGWGREREIRAELIRWLCVDQEASKKVDPRGVKVYAAKITNGLDLSFATVPFPLSLVRCRLTHDSDLRNVTIPALYLDGSSTGSLNADNAEVKGEVLLGGGFSAVGGVWLYGARVGGSVQCDSGAFENPGGDALNIQRAEVKGEVLLRDGFSAEGRVRLYGARIGGTLECARGTFKNPGGDAINADLAQVDGAVLLRDGFSAEGTVRLYGARIGSLECGGGAFKNPGGDALNVEDAEIKGSVLLRNGFSAEGAVHLAGAQIGGSLECTGGKFSELEAGTALVKGSFFWDNMRDARDTRLNLVNAWVGAIVDDEASWPKRGNLLLDGFVYERVSDSLTGTSPKGAEIRLEWLDRQEKFKPQPYRQLAKVLREMGDDGGAKQVLFELESRSRAEDRRRLVHAPARWLRFSADILSDATVGYGIYPGRAIWYLCGLTALGWIVHRRAQRVGAMAPTDKDTYDEFRNGQTPAHCQPFNPLIYSLENCIPLVKLGQDERWQPDPNPHHGVPPVAGGKFRRVIDSALDALVPDWATTPGALQWFRWIMIGLGWLLATFFVAGLTGIIKTS